MKPEELLKRFEPKPTGREITYERQLWQARYSPCGERLIASGYDATIQRWDVSGEQAAKLAPLLGHNGWVQCMEFLPSAERLATADSWGQLAVWPCQDESSKPIWTLPEAHEGWIRALAVSPDSRLIASAGNDRVVRLWSAEDGKLEQELPHPMRVFSLCFHPDAKSFVSGDLEGNIRHWDLASAKEDRKLDASLLYSHDLENEKIQHCGGARHLQFDADGKRLVCAGQKEPQGGFATGTPCALVYDWESGEQIREMPMGGAQDGFAYDARFHPEGFVMAASCAFPRKGHVWFWRPEDDKAFYSSNKLANGRSLSLHPDGRRLALLVSMSPNGNGRSLKNGEYQGGSAKIMELEFAEAAG